MKTFNEIFRSAGYDWDIEITNKFGDGEIMARKAIHEGADVVAIYGGDGSIMDVARGMLGSHIPLGIIPGGTGNALAVELGIPHNLAEACALIVNPDRTIRPIDIGQSGEKLFLLRIGIGLEAAITQAADRGLKDRIGVLAYAISILRALSQSQISQYHQVIDGKEIESEGLACMIANAATIGIPGISLSPRVNISDGLLDVFVIRKTDLAAFYSVAASMVSIAENLPDFPHWQGASISVRADPPQAVEADGELIGQSPVQVTILPRALNIIAAVSP